MHDHTIFFYTAVYLKVNKIQLFFLAIAYWDVRYSGHAAANCAINEVHLYSNPEILSAFASCARHTHTRTSGVAPVPITIMVPVSDTYVL